MIRHSQVQTAKKSIRSKIVLGFAGATAAAVVGSAGVAAAQSLGSTVTIPNKAACENYKLYGFKNRGQCVSAYEHALGNGQGNGHGYGGSGNVTNTANTAVTVSVNGNNNVVDVAINNLFGH
jgi:hypothetical protein